MFYHVYIIKKKCLPFLRTGAVCCGPVIDMVELVLNTLRSQDLGEEVEASVIYKSTSKNSQKWTKKSVILL